MAITAFALFLAVPLWAQRGGGHAGGFGGGHAGGFSGGHAGGFSGGHGGSFAGHGGFAGGHGGFSGGHVSGGHVFSGMRSPGMSRGFTHIPSARTGVSGHPLLHDRFRDSRFGDRGFHDRGFRDRGHRFRNFGFRNNCFGFGCWGYGYPWYYAGIDPWWWDSGSSYDEDYDRDRAIAAEMNAQNLQEQQMLRQEQADGDQDAYARTPRREQAREQERPEPEAAAFLPATVLVFRDQHKQDVQNYAIVGQTLWAFAPQHQKIPLSDLDLAATAKANDDRGVTFRVPAANEAQ